MWLLLTDEEGFSEEFTSWHMTHCTSHFFNLKGNQTKEASWPDFIFFNAFSSAGLHLGCFVNIYAKEILFFCFELERLAHVDWFGFTNKEKKKVGLWCILYFCHTFCPCWCHWYRLLDTKWQHSWLCLHNFQMSIFNKQDVKWSTMGFF